MNWDNFSAIDVRIECADMAKMNRVQAWARRNGATVQASRYARDAYEGRVRISGKWNEGATVQQGKAAELRALLAS